MPRLIDDWAKAHRLASVRVAAGFSLLSLLVGINEQLLPIVQSRIPPRWWPWVSAGMGLAVLVARLWKQSADQVAAQDAQAPAAETGAPQ